MLAILTTYTEFTIMVLFNIAVVDALTFVGMFVARYLGFPNPLYPRLFNLELNEERSQIAVWLLFHLFLEKIVS